MSNRGPLSLFIPAVCACRVRAVARAICGRFRLGTGAVVRRRCTGGFRLVDLLALAVASASCGVVPPQGSRRAAIAGGEGTTDFANVLSISTDSGQCTSTLIGNGVLLSAAHCVVGHNAVSARVDHRQIEVVRVVSHPGYADPSPRSNDLALLWLAQSPSPSPAALSLGAPQAGQSLRLIGFGQTPDGSSGDKRVAQNVVSRLNAVEFELDSEQGGNACPGDSGGPTFADDGALVGVVVSGLEGCGVGRTVHLRVDAYAAWIAAHVPQARGAGGQPIAIDQRPPQLTLIKPQEGATIPAELTLAFTVRDEASAVVHVEVRVDGQRVDVRRPGEFALLSVATAPGPHRLSLVATDAAGNEAQVSVSVTSAPPLISPRQFGALCLDGADCNSGLCIADEQGDFCSEQCATAALCPGGSHCQAGRCSRPAESSGGGCRLALPPSPAAGLVLWLVILLSRRRRRPRPPMFPGGLCTAAAGSDSWPSC